MALKQNIIYIYFKGKHQVTSKSQYQYNRGQYLYFADLNLPQAFEVHFSNKDKGESKTQIGSNNLVEIPDEYFWNGALQIYAWIYLHSKTTDGETIYEVRIPLTKRAKPTDEEPLPVQQSTIDRAIAELNNAVDITTENANKTDSDKIIVSNIKEDVITLKENIDSTATTINQKAQETIDASGRAETSAQNAATSENRALNYSQQAEQSAQSALESKNIAQQKSEIATNASNEALGYRNEALEAKNQAVQAKQNIVDYRDETKGYRDETLNLKNNVQTLKNQIDETAEEIESISDSVKEDAQSASQSASSASQSANSASQSANSASQSANQAEEFKNQSATNVTHYPKVVDGYWYVWDASKNEYVNTNVDARGVKGDKGDVGNGIENTVLNSDYTLTITFTDGTSYTTPSIRGEKGIKGDVGNGIASTVLNDDYTLTITFTDGTTYKTPSIRGEKGEKGEPATDMDIHICSASEYDSETRIPTITSPDDKTFYLVPTEDGTSPDLFTEWVYVNGAWEMFGSASIDLSGYAEKTDTILETTLSRGRKSNTTVGTGSIAFGNDVEASGEYSFAVGNNTIASGSISKAEGFGAVASGSNSHAEGNGTIANGSNTHAEGKYNTEQIIFSNWIANTHYNIGDKIYHAPTTYECIEENTDSTWVSSHWKEYGFTSEVALVIGNGIRHNNRSNAFMVDWSGNGHYMGDIYVGANTDSTGGTKVATINDIPEVPVDDVQINGQSIVSDGVANVPVAGANQLGVVGKPSNSFGILINASGQIYTYGATDSDIKNGTSPYRPLNATTQHKSVFYGLAKASGDTTQSTSSNVVGNYTDNAKDKIQTMLGVSPLIAPHESDPFESAHVVGELFIINGKLYRAKTALTAGEYINEGTNVEVVDVAEVLDDKIGDVQINGSSIVTDGVAEIPQASTTKMGAVVVGAGLRMNVNTGQLFTPEITLAQVKNGSEGYVSVSPKHQHESAFYGLAKASGDTTQLASSNAVGTYTDEAKASIQTMLGVPSEDNVVNDVQIDGNSIVTDGVASIPMADDTHLGAVIVNGAYGIGRFGTNGALYINYPTSAYIKSGTNNYRPIVSALQHESVFYGLAKIAGHDEKDSTLEVGTYTDEAKTAIKQMLGVHDTYDSFVEEITGTDVTITGQPSYRYNCGEVLSLSITPPESGTIDVRFTSGSTPTVLTLPSTVKMPEWWVEVEANTIYEMCITDGIYCGVMTWAM